MPYTPTVWQEGVTTLGPTNLNHLENGVAAIAALSLDAIATANATAADVSFAGHKALSVSAVQGAASSNLSIDADAAAAGTGYVLVTTKGIERLRIANGGNVSIPDISTYVDGRNRVSFPATQANAVAVDSALYPRALYVQGTAQGNNGSTGQGLFGLTVRMADAAGVVNKTITGCASHGGLIQVTTSGAHGFATGDRIVIYGVTGTTEANGAWVITVIGSTTFDLQASTFTNAYVSAGTATNRSYMCALYVQSSPSLDRNTGMTGALANCDDMAHVIVQNVGTGKANEAFYIASAPNISGAAYQAALSIGGKVDKGVQFGTAVTTWGIDFAHSTTLATYGSGAIRLPTRANGGSIWSRNEANDADVKWLNLNIADQLQVTPVVNLADDLRFGSGVNMVISTTTGTKIGDSTSAKIGFFNATPIVQPSNTTGIRTALINLGLLASGGATPLDLNGGTLTAAKGVFGTNAATTGVIGLANNGSVYGRNAANDADIALFRISTTNLFEIQTGVLIGDGGNINTGTTTGSKFGNAASQKISFYGVTPIVQPTTGISGASNTNPGTGTAITSTSTFGGYTLAQLAAILINTGLAA